MRQFIRLYLLIISVLINSNSFAADAGYDFRVVIDVSGSMKQTDPQNLRVPALRLINGLIPTGSRAGVWIFGRYVDMAVKWGQVNDSWRQQADLGANKIHSNALLTNIESALARARVGWDKPNAKSKRILLLLTDGKVDVSKDPAKNEKSRSKVLTESLSALKKAGAQIYTVALSRGADEVLLKQLALETGGSFAIAESADQLQKVFFKMFEHASQPQTVALKGKEFPIDASIKEMTLLVFRKTGSQPTLLIPPDKPAISAQKPRDSRWRSDRGYDLITVKNPQPGTWRIDAEMDPDNRLMVVTDLKLEVGELPVYSTPQVALRVTAELFNRDRKISKNSFLRFVDFDLTHIDEEGNENKHDLIHSSERKDKGQYLYEIKQNLAEGRHSFIVSADSRTFNRSKRFDIQVQWPVEVKVVAQNEAGAYELKLRAREEYLKPDGLVADVIIEAPDGSTESLTLEPALGWLVGRIETNQDGLYQAHVQVSAQSQGTEIKDIDLGKFSMLGVYRAPAGTPETTPDLEPEANKASPQEEAINWRLVGIVVVSVNVLIMVLIGLGWIIIRRKNTADETIIEDEEFSA